MIVLKTVCMNISSMNIFKYPHKLIDKCFLKDLFIYLFLQSQCFKELFLKASFAMLVGKATIYNAVIPYGYLFLYAPHLIQLPDHGKAAEDGPSN